MLLPKFTFMHGIHLCVSFMNLCESFLKHIFVSTTRRIVHRSVSSSLSIESFPFMVRGSNVQRHDELATDKLSKQQLTSSKRFSTTFRDLNHHTKGLNGQLNPELFIALVILTFAINIRDSYAFPSYDYSFEMTSLLYLLLKFGFYSATNQMIDIITPIIEALATHKRRISSSDTKLLLNLTRLHNKTSISSRSG